MITHTFLRGIATGSFTTQRKVEVSAEQDVCMDVEVPVGNNQLFALALDVSQLKSLYIEAVGGALTLKTNSSGSPANTITLADGVPFSWIQNNGALADTSGAAITTDITALYVTNGTAAAVSLKFATLLDPTV